MQYINRYESPLGGILLAADGIRLTGLWFEGQKYYARTLDEEHEEKNLEVFRETRRWLDIYFSGQEPDFMPDIHLTGTQFQVRVWELLRQIPYGQTVTYREIAGDCLPKKAGTKPEERRREGPLPGLLAAL